jgi:DNA-directed RNA polymerase specialized sigma24 family protein
MIDQRSIRGRPKKKRNFLRYSIEGMTANEIGRRLGRTRLAVYARLQRFRKQQGRVSRTSGDDPSRNAPAQNHG